MIDVAVVGGRGFVGGELLRLLYHHPDVGRVQVTSESSPGRAVESQHPPLRGSGLVYVRREDVEPTDAVFLAGTHGSSVEIVREGALAGASWVIDLSADFRLADSALMQRHYGWRRHDDEPAFVPGIPELHRERIKSTARVAVPGCMANTAILMLHPLVASGSLDSVHVDARTGSSGSGASSNDANQHSVRAGAMRVFAPLGHRHTAEIAEQLGIEVTMTATATPQVRGIQTLAAVRIPGATHADLLTLYRQQYGEERFIRLLGGTRGEFRYPDPKVLLGSNFCDMALGQDATDPDLFLVMAATDNLMKGAAGNAVQSLNIMAGLPEDAGLTFPGLHPV